MNTFELFRILIKHHIIPTLNPKFLFIRKQHSTIAQHNIDFMQNDLPVVLDKYISRQQKIDMKGVIFRAGAYSFHLLRHLLHCLEEDVAGRNGYEQFLEFMEAETHLEQGFKDFIDHENLLSIVKHMKTEMNISSMPPPLYNHDFQETKYVSRTEITALQDYMIKLRQMLNTKLPTKMCKQELNTFSNLTKHLSITLEKASTENLHFPVFLFYQLKTLLKQYSEHFCFKKHENAFPKIKLNIRLLLRTVETILAKQSSNKELWPSSQKLEILQQKL